MASERQAWRPAESRLLAEYLAARWPHDRTITRVRVGERHPGLTQADLTDPERRMLGVWRRWVDAVIVLAAEVILVEAAIRPDPGDISQLDLYMRLWPATPEFADLRGRRARGHLLYAQEDPIIRQLALERGYTVEVWRPAWVDGYMESLSPRARRAPLTVLP